MSKSPRIFNVTRGFHLKHSQALRAIENCACAWVEVGKSIRNLTLAESIAARNEQARTQKPNKERSLPFAELFGVYYEPAPDAILAGWMEMQLARQGDEFADTQASQ